MGGVTAGMEIQATTTDGQTLSVCVPAGVKPGEVFKYQPRVVDVADLKIHVVEREEAATKLQIDAPDGQALDDFWLADGMEKEVNTPDGQTLSVYVPDGIQPGEFFTVQYQPLAFRDEI